MENKKTISDLNSRAWYRFLKVIYWFCFVISIFVFYKVIMEPYPPEQVLFYFVPATLTSIVLFWIIKKLFFYIVLGSFRPEKYRGITMKDSQIKFDIELAQKYGVEEAIVIGILYDPSFMLYAEKKSQYASEMAFLYKGKYPWDIVGKDVEDGRTWIALNDREFEILFPFWKTDYAQEVLNRLVEKRILDSKGGHENRGTFYSLNPEIAD